jgi:hypothetical protein
MKIRFRIGDAQGNGHGREQSRPQDCPVNPPSPWSPRHSVPCGTPPTKIPVDHSLRRGTACCARFGVVAQRHSLAISRSIPPIASWLRFQAQPGRSATAYEPRSTPQALPTAKNSREIALLSCISTRFWSKSRSYRKQTTKPLLPGSRIARCHALSLRDFSANFAPAELRRCRPLFAQRTTQS